MISWVVASIASGLGASWALDALKPWVSVPIRLKAPAFLCLDLGALAAVTLLGRRFPPAQVVVASVFLSLGVGKATHGVLSMLQAVKDSHRWSLMRPRSPRGPA